MKNKQIKAGDVFATNEGGSVTVIEYRDWGNVLIEHNDSFKHRAAARADQLRDGRVKNPYYPSVYGAGFIGAGEYRAKERGKHTPAYRSWVSMLRRCYSAELHVKRPTYVGCGVHPDWYNFQNYAAWFNSQPNSKNAGFELDKDLLILGNKVYSEATCSFVPQEINGLLNDHGSARGEYPQGVSASYKGFRSEISVNGKRIRLGRYTTPGQAYAVYKKAKEENVRRMAVEWREHLHPAVYANLAAYEL